MDYSTFAERLLIGQYIQEVDNTLCSNSDLLTMCTDKDLGNRLTNKEDALKALWETIVFCKNKGYLEANERFKEYKKAMPDICYYCGKSLPSIQSKE